MDLNKIKIETLSAVMVLHDLSSDSLILTKRSHQLRNHPGEICFPGGRWEAGDADLYATALRELYEELGVDALRIKPLKELQTERTLLGTVIHPWLATIESIKPFTMNAEEVLAVINIPMHLVKTPENYREITISRYGHQFKSCEFIPNTELVWGATARIMRQLSI